MDKRFQGSKKKARRKGFLERQFKRMMHSRIEAYQNELLDRAIENGNFEQALAIMTSKEVNK